MIIPVDGLDRVQAMIRKPGRILSRKGTGESLLRGLVRCGGCGAAMTMESTSRGRKTYRYVRCPTYQKKGDGACSTKARLPAGPVEEVLVGVLRKHAARANFASDVGAAMRAQLGALRGRLEVEATALPRSIGEASSRVHSLALAIGDAPEAARRVLTRRLDEESAIVARQEERLATVQRELRDLDTTEAEIAWVEGSLGRFDGIWDVLTDANRVRLVRALVRGVVVDLEREQVHVELATDIACARRAAS